jgi:hypothetical protein
VGNKLSRKREFNTILRGSMLFLVVLSLFCVIYTHASVCNPANMTQVGDSWPFTVNPGTHPSCASSSGGVNDMGNVPTQCDGDPASVRIEVTPGAAECLVANVFDCKIPMYDFVSLDFDFDIDGCNGVWAAPLWMTPDTWQWGPGSGEIDGMEFCWRDAINLNFAGGGHQISLPADQFSIDSSAGHITVRKDNTGIVTITACTKQEASADPNGQCSQPVYNNCAECMDGGNTYACWCNEGTNPPNIYGSGGCMNGGDCMWTLVSDLWNGVTGDEGYQACMIEVPGVVGAGQPNYNTQCKTSVQKIKLRGGGPNQSLQWGVGSPAHCSVFTPSVSAKEAAMLRGASRP